MAHVILRPGWYLSERDATPESAYRNRRQFIRELGLGGLGAAALFGSAARGQQVSSASPPASASAEAAPAGGTTYPPAYARRFPFPHDKKFTAERALTDEKQATTYCNFYEFSLRKHDVQDKVGKLVLNPWEIRIDGLCEKPGSYDVYELIGKLPVEERVYRHRCVEAWAMTLPWTGFPMKALLDHVGVKNEAKYIRFVTFMRPDQAPGITEHTNYPFPYYDAMTLPEAMTEVAFFGTGLYGKPMPKQNGGPLRVVAPWKYGLKSIKSLVHIEFTEKRPGVFWHDVNAKEYSWDSNVDPDVPHPRWSQKKERLIGRDGTVPTRKYNGYSDYVAQLYG